MDVDFIVIKGVSMDELAKKLKEVVVSNVILVISNIIQEGKYLKMILQVVPRVVDVPTEKDIAKSIKIVENTTHAKNAIVEKSSKIVKKEKTVKKGVKHGSRK